MIRFEHVSFRYEDSKAGVEDICLNVGKGECVVITGPSGNGKTTLIRLVNGLAPAYYAGYLSGTVRLSGKDRSSEPLWKRGKMVGSVFQEPKSQFFSSEMAGEIAFACENYGLPHQEIAARTDEAMEKFHLEKLKDRPLDVLSGGEKQRTAVASVYVMKPPVYVCDEPTANLDGQGCEELRETLMKLKQEGAALMIAEHRLSWLEGVADRFVYIRDGKILWERTPEQMKELAAEELERLGLRAVKPSIAEVPSEPTGKDMPVLSLKSLSCRRNKKTLWENICFSVWPGQIAAITGKNGAGKTTLAKIIAGLENFSKGEICIQGKKAKAAQRRKNCWYSSNNTGTQFFTNSVTEELLLGLPRTDEVLKKARSLLKQFGLYDFKEAHPAVLSGGQRQRLAIACGLLSGRKILLLDEPTSGLDGGNMRKVSAALKAAAKEGRTILIITHDEELIEACCDFCWKIDDPVSL